MCRIQWPEVMEINSQTVRPVCEGVQAPHGQAEILCYCAKMLGNLFINTSQTGMTLADWSWAQYQDPIIKQILQAIHNHTISKWKLTSDMYSDLKSLIRTRKKLKVKQSVPNRKPHNPIIKLDFNYSCPVITNREE